MTRPIKEPLPILMTKRPKPNGSAKHLAFLTVKLRVLSCPDLGSAGLVGAKRAKNGGYKSAIYLRQTPDGMTPGHVETE